MKVSTGLLASLLASVVMQGCIMDGMTKPVAPQVVPVSGIDAAAAEASGALTRLAEIERARTPRAVSKDVPSASIPGEMKRRMDVAWVGGPDAITQQVASTIGYEFKIYGKPPVVPIVVSLDKRGTTVYDVLKDIGYQCAERADLRIDLREKRIGLFYAR